MATIYKTLYNIDSAGKVRVWWMEAAGDTSGRFRTHSGIQDGKIVTTEWSVAKPKNVGKKNATTADQQADSEIKSLYTKKLERKYYETLEEASSAGSGLKFTSVMLAEKYADVRKKQQAGKKNVFSEDESVFIQPKLDGMRCVMSKDGSLSRGGKPVACTNHVSAALTEFFKKFPDVILDGELYNHEFKDDFNEVMSMAKKQKPGDERRVEIEEKIEYHVYDVILPTNPAFEDRMAFIDVELARCLEGIENHPIRIVETLGPYMFTSPKIDDHYGNWIGNGYEGMMYRLNLPYEHGRTDSLIKRKEFVDEEFELTDIMPGDGNWSGMAKRIEFKLPDDRRKQNGERPKAGIRGTQDQMRDLLKRWKDGTGPKWATVRFPSYTPDGIPRFGQATRFYDEKRDD